ncbi:MAG: lipocalin-like domain-containing protein [Chloroflexi bacterium]|nr:lipocalin-like domain-containing protein [Chloroflexota bacterium]
MSGNDQAPSKEEIEQRKKEIKNTLCCPHCGEKLSKWAVPHTLFTTWTNDFMYVCFNDECNYLLRGFEAAARVGNSGSYRLMYDPELDCCQPVPVLSKQALREGIVDEADEVQKTKAEVDRESIVGTWKLVSSKMMDTGGQTSYPLGQEPQGMLVYLEDGRMTIQNMPADGTSFQSTDGNTIALETYGAYSGRYELVSGDKIIHHIENSIHPDWNNLKQERSIEIESDRLTLVSPLLAEGNKLHMAHMTWKKSG